MIRITGSMMHRRYKSNINMNTVRMDKNGLQVSTFRKFQRGSEDPMSALKALQVRRNLETMYQETKNLDMAETWLAQTETAAMGIKDCVDRAIDLALQGRNDILTEDDRMIIANDLKSVQKELVKILNTQVAGKYIFGGINTKVAPFSIYDPIDGNPTEVCDDPNYKEYTRVPVYYTDPETGEVKVGEDFFYNDPKTGAVKSSNVPVRYRDPNTDDIEYGYPTEYKDPDTGIIGQNHYTGIGTKEEKTWLYTFRDYGYREDGKFYENSIYFNGVSLSETATLSELNIRPVYYDVGLGLRMDKEVDEYGNEILTTDENSVFDLYMTGVELIGYGENNLYNLIGQLADAFRDNNMKVIDGGILNDVQMPEGVASENITPGIFSKLQDAQLNVLLGIVKIGENTNFLGYLQDMNTDSVYIAEVLQNKLEVVNPDQAIMDFKMQEVVYQACLQMGNYILQPSLMSYLK